MTNEQAIKFINGHIKDSNIAYGTFTGQALRMAIKALKAQPDIIRCKDCKHNVSSHKCLHPESFFLVPDDDFYCGYAERRGNGQQRSR